VPTDQYAAEVELLCGLLSEHYVFPEVAGRVMALLRSRQAAGGYADLAGDQAFAAAVTADMQSVNGDRHLRLMYRTEPVPQDAEPFDLDRYRADAQRQAYGFHRVERLPGNVGVCENRALFAAKVAGPAASAALSLLAHTDALIIDLRRCPGGDPAQIALICSYLFDEPTHLNDIHSRRDGSVTQFWTLPYVPGERFGGGKPIWVLTSGTTFSGAEELAYNLQSRRRATIVGERSRGGAHPCDWYRIGTHLQASLPFARSVNPVTGTNWEGTGVAPDIEVAAEAAFDRAYRLALEHVLTLDNTGPRRALGEETRDALAALAAEPRGEPIADRPAHPA
jgi:hypothetical protein